MIAIEPLDGVTVGAEFLHEANLAMDLELVFAAWVVFRAPAPRHPRRTPSAHWLRRVLPGEPHRRPEAWGHGGDRRRYLLVALYASRGDGSELCANLTRQ